MFVNKLFTYSRALILKHKRFFNVKSSTYCFHVKTKILGDFQICISVPLENEITEVDYWYALSILSPETDYEIHLKRNLGSYFDKNDNQFHLRHGKGT